MLGVLLLFFVIFAAVFCAKVAFAEPGRITDVVWRWSRNFVVLLMLIFLFAAAMGAFKPPPV